MKSPYSNRNRNFNISSCKWKTNMSKKEDKCCSKCLYSVNIRPHMGKELICCAPHGIWNDCHKNGPEPIEVTRV